MIEPTDTSNPPLSKALEQRQQSESQESMSFVTVQRPAAPHTLGRARPYHSFPHGPQTVVDMSMLAGPRTDESGCDFASPPHNRYYSSHHHSSQRDQHEDALQRQRPAYGLRLPPPSILTNLPDHGESTHTRHLPPQLRAPPPPSGHGHRDPPLAIKTHHQHHDSYAIPSPVTSVPGVQTSPGMRPARPALGTLCPGSTSSAEARQASYIQSMSSPSPTREDQPRYLPEEQPDATVIQQLRDKQRLDPRLVFDTRPVPPPRRPPPLGPTRDFAASQATSMKGSPVNKLKISDLLDHQDPQQPSPPSTFGESQELHPQLPPPMPPSLSTPSLPDLATSRSCPFPSSSTSATQSSSVIYTLRIRQQPAAARSCGFGERDRRVIDPPPILQLLIHADTPAPSPSSPSSCSSQQEQRQKQRDPPRHAPNPDETSRLHRLLHYPYYVLHASIYDLSGQHDSSRLSPQYRSQRRLMGTLVSSPFVGSDEYGIEGCFFTFPDLSCRTPGKYRLKFNLVVLNPREITTGHVSKVKAAVLSDVFTVYNAKDFPGMQASSALARRLREQGCLIGIKKGNDGRGGGTGAGRAGGSGGKRGRRESEEDQDEESEEDGYEGGDGRGKKVRK